MGTDLHAPRSLTAIGCHRQRFGGDERLVGTGAKRPDYAVDDVTGKSFITVVR